MTRFSPMRRPRLVRPFLAGLGLFLAILASGPTLAQDRSENAAEATTIVEPMRIANGTRFGAWTVNCEAIAVNETACVLSQRLVRTADNAFLAELLAFWSGDGSKSYMAARVPNGVYLPAGFALKPEADEQRYDFAWQSCGRDLCETLRELSSDELLALNEAEAVVAGYRPSLVAKPVVFKLSTQGVGEGLQALKASMQRATP